MSRWPKTKAEAAQIRYGSWAGNPQGYPLVHELCAARVSRGSDCRVYQCQRKNGHGPDGLYCKQHAAKVPGDEK